MKYRIEISSVAEAEADSAFLRLSQLNLNTLVHPKPIQRVVERTQQVKYEKTLLVLECV